VRFLAAGQTARAKLGWKPARGSAATLSNAAIPAIPLAHSILFEAFIKFTGITGLPSTIMSHTGGAINIATAVAPYRNVSFYTNGGAQIVTIPEPKGLTHYLFLIDKTNTLFRVFHQGQPAISQALTAVPNLSGGIWTLQMGGNHNDIIGIIYRLTTLSSVPADIDAAIKRMYARPMVLDASLQAVAVIASQWDFEDVGYGTGAITTVADHGVVGGYPLTSSVDYKSLLVEVEKP